jgi:superfamily II DNA or RNA helicase
MKNTILCAKGYAIPKESLSAKETLEMKRILTVVPKTPPAYAAKISPFPVFMESAKRWYLPRSWATQRYGEAESDAMPEGDTLRASLQFTGNPRDHQIKAIETFRKAGHCGILCLPCGYGKTFTAIAIAAALKRRFIVVVHKEFLVDQWSGELKSLLPGIRIGRIQGERCDIGEEFDCAIAMIQTICSRTYPSGIFAGFGLAIFDEAHHLGAEHFSQTLQRIQCKAMLGLTATPQRTDGLTKVFEWFLGPIVFQISKRDEDKSVRVEVMRYTAAEDEYTDVPTDWKGEVIRARLLNQIAEFKPRTEALLNWIHDHMQVAGRKLLILSDRREHLAAFEAGMKARGHTSIGYYVGGMKQTDLDKSAERGIILGTFAMAAEGMNIPTLNAVLLATPKSNVEQSVGRILRQRPEERAVFPLILDVLDAPHMGCVGQWNKRAKFYRSCGYKIQWLGEGDSGKTESGSDSEPEEEPETKKAKKTKTPKCLIADDEKTCCTSVCPECINI